MQEPPRQHQALRLGSVRVAGQTPHPQPDLEAEPLEVNAIAQGKQNRSLIINTQLKQIFIFFDL